MNLKREKNLRYKELRFYSNVKSIIHDEKFMLILAPYIGDKENKKVAYPFGHIAIYEEELYESFLTIKKYGTIKGQINKLEKCKLKKWSEIECQNYM